MALLVSSCTVMDMPGEQVGERYDISYLELDNGSTYEKLLNRCPDIQPMRFRDQEYIIRQGEVSKEIYIVYLL